MPKDGDLVETRARDDGAKKAAGAKRRAEHPPRVDVLAQACLPIVADWPADLNNRERCLNVLPQIGAALAPMIGHLTMLEIRALHEAGWKEPGDLDGRSPKERAREALLTALEVFLTQAPLRSVPDAKARLLVFRDWHNDPSAHEIDEMVSSVIALLDSLPRCRGGNLAGATFAAWVNALPATK